MVFIDWMAVSDNGGLRAAAEQQQAQTTQARKYQRGGFRNGHNIGAVDVKLAPIVVTLEIVKRDGREIVQCAASNIYDQMLVTDPAKTVRVGRVGVDRSCVVQRKICIVAKAPASQINVNGVIRSRGGD